MSQPINPGASARDLPREVAAQVPALARAEREFARSMARDLGLAPVDLYALGELLAGPPVGVVDLGRRLGLGSAAATGLADRLEVAGHVRRTPHPSDRRRLVLSVTDSARAEFFGRLQTLTADAEELLEAFSEDELAVISRFMHGMTDLYRRHAEPADDPS